MDQSRATPAPEPAAGRLYGAGPAAPRPKDGRPLAEARRRLAAPRRPDGSLRLLGASALLAISAVLLAGSVILGPFWETRATSATVVDALFQR